MSSRYKPTFCLSIAMVLIGMLAPFYPGISSFAGPTSSLVNDNNSFAFPEFQANWDRADGPVASGQISRSWLWGPSPGATVQEPFAQSKGGSRTVQYFDKARMELNDEVVGDNSQWRVTTGLLVAEMVSGRIQTGEQESVARTPSQEAVAGDPYVGSNPTYSDFAKSLTSARNRTGSLVADTLSFPSASPATAARTVTNTAFVKETGHNIPDVFWKFLNQKVKVRSATGVATDEPLFDWVYIIGYPITEAYWVNITVGEQHYDALVQLFERRTLTYVPALAVEWQVQMGNVGQHYYEWRYGKSEPHINLPPLKAAEGKFVGIQGASFVYGNAPVKLKGTNYWLSTAPFALTWAQWNGPRARTELQKARDLGVNTVRIGIPYDNKDTRDVIWGNFRVMEKVGPWIISQMTQVLQIASEYNMKVIFVLFEWYDQQPAPNTPDEATNLAYLDGIVTPFANDDRVLAWDLRNEPDFYGAWKDGKQDGVITWLKRMALHVRQTDNRHPLTVGVGNYKSLWQNASNGTSILSFVDFVAFHCYDAGALAGQIADIKAHTSKPILLEEMGWPTSAGKEKAPANAVYDEATQAFLYQTMLGASKQADIAGVVQWTLLDYAAGATLHDNFESYFGLFKRDGSTKPATSIFKSEYTAPPLESNSRSNEPLDTSDKPNER